MLDHDPQGAVQIEVEAAFLSAELISQLGYPGLFIVSFLAATILPLGSEAAVAAMVASALSPVGVLVVATTGNSLGSLANYAVGRLGSRLFLSRWVRPDMQKIERTSALCRRWGEPALFFAWLPVIGDPLTIAAGMANLRMGPFLFWVILGKGLRYLLIVQGVRGLV